MFKLLSCEDYLSTVAGESWSKKKVLLSFSFPLEYSGLDWVEGGLLEYSRRCFSLFPTFPTQPFSTNSIKRSNPLPPTSDFRKLEKFGKSLERRSCFSQQFPLYSSVQEIGFCFIYAAMQHLNIPRWCCHFHPYTAILDIANIAEEITMTILADGKDGYGGQCGSALQHHLLPLLPRHHRLPRTPGQQVRFFFGRNKLGESCAQVSPASVRRAQHHARGPERHQPHIVSWRQPTRICNI